MAKTCHQLGMIAHERGETAEAEKWYRKALNIHKTVDDRQDLTSTYGQLGLLTEEQGNSQEALDWIVRCVSLFKQFPHPMTGPAPKHLAHLTDRLGMEALEASWRKVTAKELPEVVRQEVERIIAEMKKHEHPSTNDKHAGQEGS